MTKPRKNAAKPSADTLRKKPPSEEQLTMQEILHLGEEAAKLLQSETYNLAHEMTLNQLVDDWMGTAHDQTALRETLYHEAQALGSVARKLKAMIDAAQQVNLQETERAERDLHRYEDEQGFM